MSLMPHVRHKYNGTLVVVLNEMTHPTSVLYCPSYRVVQQTYGMMGETFFNFRPLRSAAAECCVYFFVLRCSD